MIHKLRKIFYTLFVTALSLPLVSRAAEPSDHNSNVKLDLPEGVPTDVSKDATLVFSNIFAFAFRIAIALTVLSIVGNGIRYIAAYGNEEQIEKARKGLLYSIIGLSILILAYVIASTVDVIIRNAS